MDVDYGQSSEKTDFSLNIWQQNRFWHIDVVSVELLWCCIIQLHSSAEAMKQGEDEEGSVGEQAV